MEQDSQINSMGLRGSGNDVYAVVQSGREIYSVSGDITMTRNRIYVEGTARRRANSWGTRQENVWYVRQQILTFVGVKDVRLDSIQFDTQVT